MRTRYISLLLLSLLSMGMGACNKWLDVKPKDKFLEPQMFDNVEGAATALNGIYLQLSSSALYGRQLTMQAVEILAQRYNIVTPHRDLSFQSYSWEQDTVKARFAAIWESAYAGVVNANQFVRNLEVYEGPSITADLNALMRGEAIGIRALLQFDMLRLYGPIYNTKDSLSPSIPYYRKASPEIGALLPANQVIDSILADLTLAEQLLQKDPIITSGVSTVNRVDGLNWLVNRNLRMNFFAVKALQARVHLYRNNKPAALEAAKAVVDMGGRFFPWIKPARIISDRIDPERVFPSELILSVFNIDLYNHYKAIFAPELRDGVILAPNDTRLKAIFENNEGDYRYNPMWILPTVGGKAYKTFYKYSDIQNTDSSFRFKMPLIRISEMYYIMAECEPDAVKGRDYINTVRRNRGLPDLAATANVNTELQKEHQKEFIGEGQLFFYYKRRNVTSIPNGAATTGNVTMNAAKYVVPLPLSETLYR